jgi:hypothetical protein
MQPSHIQFKIAELTDHITQLAEHQRLLAENQRQLVRMCLDLQTQIGAIRGHPPIQQELH